MPVDFGLLEQTARLTKREIPALSDEEWIEVKRVRDFLLQTEAEMRAWSEARQQAEEANEDPPQRISNGRLLYWQWELMVENWNLYTPDHTPIPFTQENRRKFFKYYGLYLTPEIVKRGGATAGDPVKEVDPDGDPLTFQEGAVPTP